VGFGVRYATRIVDCESAPVEAFEIRPLEEVLDAWRAHELLLDPATRSVVSPDDLEGIEVAHGVRALPLRTATLPPATHTNCYIVGHNNSLIIDPGSHLEEEQDRLSQFVEKFSALYGQPAGIFLTHHHGDHTGGAAALRESTGLPILAHVEAANRLEFSVDRCVEQGERFGDWETYWTPGHAPGHLCLFNVKSRQLVAGDMIASVGTIVVEPSCGDMALYMAGLERLKMLDARVAYPAHGEHIGDPSGRFQGYLNHRRWREHLVESALSNSFEPLSEVTRRAYQDVAPHILWLAERQALAHLIKLAAETRAVERENCWAKCSE